MILEVDDIGGVEMTGVGSCLCSGRVVQIKYSVLSKFEVSLRHLNIN
jgi:hypothetical protein